MSGKEVRFSTWAVLRILGSYFCCGVCGGGEAAELGEGNILASTVGVYWC